MSLIRKILRILFYLIPILIFGVVLLGYFDVRIPVDIYHLEYNTDMARQKSINQYEGQAIGDSIKIIKRAENSVSSKEEISFFESLDKSDSLLNINNPLPLTDEVLKRGENRFQVFCTPCHGVLGDSKGLVITDVELQDDEEGFPQPPSLLREKAQNYSDGKFFKILTKGQNLMFPTTHKMNTKDRWAVIHYIRNLQQTGK